MQEQKERGVFAKIVEARTLRANHYCIELRICDILIMHGDSDNSVPLSISERFYGRLVAEGKEQHADLYILAHGGHGTPEFYQESVKKSLKNSSTGT